MQDGLKIQKKQPQEHNKSKLAQFNCIGYFYNLKLIAEHNIRTMESYLTTNQQPGTEQPPQ